VEGKRSRTERVGKIGREEALLYIITSGGRVTFNAIRAHLKSELNLRARSAIKDYHIKTLLELELISAEPKKGKETIYYVTPSFEWFRRVVNFLDATYKLKFMKTQFFKEFVDSQIFEEKLFLKIVKDLVLDFIAYSKTDEGKKVLAKHAKDKSGKNFVAILSNFDASKPDLGLGSLTTNQDMLDTIEPIRRCLSDVDIFYSFLREFPFSGLVTKISHIFFTDSEMADILLMIKTSPSTLNLILNLQGINSLGLFDIWMRYIFRTINTDAFLSEVNKYIDKEKPNFSEIYKIILKVLNDSKLKSPIYKIISMQFILDVVNKNLVWRNEEQAEKMSDLIEKLLFDTI
jgi:hypothetical protein